MIAALLLLLCGAAQAAVLPQLPAPATMLRGDLRVLVVDARPADAEAVEGADALAQVTRAGVAAVRAEVGWVGDRGPVLRLGLRSLGCEGQRPPVCSLEVDAAFDDQPPFAHLSSTAAGTRATDEALASALERFSAQLRAALAAEPGFAAALADPRDAPQPRTVTLLRWQEAGGPRTAALIATRDEQRCVADADGTRWLPPGQPVDATEQRIDLRAPPGDRWLVAVDADGALISGAFAGTVGDGVAVDTGTRRRVLAPSALSDLFVSPAEPRCEAALAPPPSLRPDDLVLVDVSGRPLPAGALDRSPGTAPHLVTRAVRRGDAQRPLTLAAFLEAVDSPQLNGDHRAAAERIRRTGRADRGLAALGVALGGLGLGFGLYAAGAALTPGDGVSAQHDSVTLAASASLPLLVVGLPVAIGGAAKEGRRRRRLARLEAGHLELLRDPRVLWIAVQEHNRRAR